MRAMKLHKIEEEILEADGLAEKAAKNGDPGGTENLGALRSAVTLLRRELAARRAEAASGLSGSFAVSVTVPATRGIPSPAQQMEGADMGKMRQQTTGRTPRDSGPSSPLRSAVGHTTSTAAVGSPLPRGVSTTCAPGEETGCEPSPGVSMRQAAVAALGFSTDGQDAAMRPTLPGELMWAKHNELIWPVQVVTDAQLPDGARGDSAGVSVFFLGDESDDTGFVRLLSRAHLTHVDLLCAEQQLEMLETAVRRVARDLLDAKQRKKRGPQVTPSQIAHLRTGFVELRRLLGGGASSGAVRLPPSEQATGAAIKEGGAADLGTEDAVLQESSFHPKRRLKKVKEAVPASEVVSDPGSAEPLAEDDPVAAQAADGTAECAEGLNSAETLSWRPQPKRPRGRPPAAAAGVQAGESGPEEPLADELMADAEVLEPAPEPKRPRGRPPGTGRLGRAKIEDVKLNPQEGAAPAVGEEADDPDPIGIAAADDGDPSNSRGLGGRRGRGRGRGRGRRTLPVRMQMEMPNRGSGARRGGTDGSEGEGDGDEDIAGDSLPQGGQEENGARPRGRKPLTGAPNQTMRWPLRSSFAAQRGACPEQPSRDEDVKVDDTGYKTDGDEALDKREGPYSPGDVVWVSWGKQWWPAVIEDRDSSDETRRIYSESLTQAMQDAPRRAGQRSSRSEVYYLVLFIGERTHAVNSTSEMKPFDWNFVSAAQELAGKQRKKLDRYLQIVHAEFTPRPGAEDREESGDHHLEEGEDGGGDVSFDAGEQLLAPSSRALQVMGHHGDLSSCYLLWAHWRDAAWPVRLPCEVVGPSPDELRAALDEFKATFGPDVGLEGAQCVYFMGAAPCGDMLQRWRYVALRGLSLLAATELEARLPPVAQGANLVPRSLRKARSCAVEALCGHVSSHPDAPEALREYVNSIVVWRAAERQHGQTHAPGRRGRPVSSSKVHGHPGSSGFKRSRYHDGEEEASVRADGSVPSAVKRARTAELFGQHGIGSSKVVKTRDIAMGGKPQLTEGQSAKADGHTAHRLGSISKEEESNEASQAEHRSEATFLSALNAQQAKIAATEGDNTEQHVGMQTEAAYFGRDNCSHPVEGKTMPAVEAAALGEDGPLGTISRVPPGQLQAADIAHPVAATEIPDTERSLSNRLPHDLVPPSSGTCSALDSSGEGRMPQDSLPAGAAEQGIASEI